PPRYTLFPYTTLFRSEVVAVHDRVLVKAALGKDAHDLEFQVDPLVVESGKSEALADFFLERLEAFAAQDDGFLVGLHLRDRGARSEEHTSELQSPDHL